MESYIIRIYRRDEADQEAVSGLLEGSELDGAIPFSNIRQVLDILMKPGPEGTALKKEKEKSNPVKNSRAVRIEDTLKTE